MGSIQDIESEDHANADFIFTGTTSSPFTRPHGDQFDSRKGHSILHDRHLIDLLAHFNRERIPERVVHAKGAGAYGEFEVRIHLKP